MTLFGQPNILRPSDGNQPVNIANIEDLPVEAANFGIGTDELDGDGCLSQIGAHGEVGDGGHQGDGSGDVVKDALRTRLGEGEADKGQGGHEHDGGDSLWASVSGRAVHEEWITDIVPVGAMRGDGDVGNTAIHRMRHRMAVGINSSVSLDHDGRARDEKG